MGTEMERDGTERMEGMEQHLLFHKSLIDDSVGTEKIDRFIGVLKDSGPGETMGDPVDESIRSAFSLVLEHDMDPWYIDIVEFSRLYSLKKVKSAVDIMVAGKLIHMAWKILRMQSDKTLKEGEFADPFGDDNFLTDFDFGEMYEPDKLYVPEVEFNPAIRRSAVRSVTMMELLDVFEGADEFAEIYEERERVRLELKAKEPRFVNKAHEEDDDKAVKRVWTMIENLGTGPLNIRDLYVNNIEANITTFVSVLHLVKDGRLTIWQDTLPHGDIFVEIKMDWSDGVVEDSRSEELIKRAVV